LTTLLFGHTSGYFQTRAVKSKFIVAVRLVFFSLIDRMFGTFYLPGDEFPKEYGVNMPNYPKGFLAQFGYPFRAK
jgi:hypothetical protein